MCEPLINRLSYCDSDEVTSFGFRTLKTLVEKMEIVSFRNCCTTSIGSVAMDLVQHPMDVVQHRMDVMQHRMDVVQHPMDLVQHPMDVVQHWLKIDYGYFKYFFIY